MKQATLTQTLLALVHVTHDWHSGQWSRGYRLLCLSQRALARRSYNRPLDLTLGSRTREVYRHLAAYYGRAL